MTRQEINVALLGLGVVGSGVARALLEKADLYSSRLGLPLRLRHILVQDCRKPRPLELGASLLTSDAEALLRDESVDLVVEVMGGERPAYDYIKEAMDRGRYVVTANKLVMALHGPELLALAQKRDVDILYEASVGGGIPIISPLKRDLSANRITSITAIINGTTNYILTRMSRDGIDFADALSQAQALGYAEADPSTDIEGQDAVYKLAILASLAFHARVHPQDIHREGIARLSARDFRYARELGYAIKLQAIARMADGGLQLRVHPVLMPEDEQLAKVDGVLNAVQVEGDLLGPVLFQGAGAGSLPTTSAVVADVLDAAQALTQGARSPPGSYTSDVKVLPMADLSTRYYIRTEVADSPGVLGQMARCFGDNNVSIASVIQKEANQAAQTAEIVIMTHPAREADIQTAVRQLEALDTVAEIGNLLRVEG
ncbi:MAG: homoserine dehydrogenase [Dehalococcoidia bacterium]